MASGCTHEDASFISLDDLDKISVLLGKVSDLEEEITHLFTEVFLLSSLKKNPTNQVLNILKALPIRF